MSKVKTKVASDAPFRAVGLTAQDLRQMYWYVTLGRTLDQRSLDTASRTRRRPSGCTSTSCTG